MLALIYIYTYISFTLISTLREYWEERSCFHSRRCLRRLSTFFSFKSGFQEKRKKAGTFDKQRRRRTHTHTRTHKWCSLTDHAQKALTTAKQNQKKKRTRPPKKEQNCRICIIHHVFFFFFYFMPFPYFFALKAACFDHLPTHPLSGYKTNAAWCLQNNSVNITDSLSTPNQYQKTEIKCASRVYRKPRMGNGKH